MAGEITFGIRFTFQINKIKIDEWNNNVCIKPTRKKTLKKSLKKTTARPAYAYPVDIKESSLSSLLKLLRQFILCAIAARKMTTNVKQREALRHDLISQVIEADIISNRAVFRVQMLMNSNISLLKIGFT